MVLDNWFSKINSMRGNSFVNLSLFSWQGRMVRRYVASLLVLVMIQSKPKPIN